MAIEVEARFSAPGRDALDRLATRASLGGATLGPPRTVVELDRYLDTADGRLGSARWACRLRSRDESTTLSLKGPPEAPVTGWLHRRPEVEGPASSDVEPGEWPPSAARDLLLRLSGGAPLVERLRLLQERTERAVTLDGHVLGTLTLDVVTAHRGVARLGEMHVVELEILAGRDADRELAPLAEALAMEPDLEPEPRTKLELALELAPAL